MKGWAQLKEAFWAAADSDPVERASQIAALASIDPELPNRLEALLAADGRGESLDDLFQLPPGIPSHPARIGAYDVVGILGTGGMGEVYRARDLRLQREVAIKVLPNAVANDPERLARFQREAQVLASLNHPNIAQVYGLDETGVTPALVMELVPGPTLAEVIAGYSDAPLALTRALTIARQIAVGLDVAHEKGIIHRDLKPGNVALTPDEDVKILDFGIAKSLDTGWQPRPSTSGTTGAGVVLGTPAYMSPEQARGLIVDKRTDIWAFGCLLYELLTGRQAFAGETASDSLAAVLERDPDMALVPAATPPAVRSLLRHCLEKDPKRRLRDIADARLAIDEALNRRPDEQAAEVATPRASRAVLRIEVRWLLVGFALATVVAAGAMQLLRGKSPPPDDRRKVITSLVLPRALRLGGSASDLEAQGSESRFAVSPDGRKLALIAVEESGRTRLWVRSLASSAFQPLPETVGASFPFWSPDSESIGFVADGKLKTIRLSDAHAMTVSETGFRRGVWTRDNRILFTPARSSPLYVVPSSGGVPTPVTTLDKAHGEVQHGYPALLPDGRHFLYFSIGTQTGGALDPRGIYLGSLEAAEPARRFIPAATQPGYANDHVLFIQNGTLMAQPFDLQSGQLRGAPLPLVEDVRLSTTGATGATAAYSVSDNGVLVYQAAMTMESRPMWFDRTGRPLGAITAAADYADLTLSPDGTRLAVSVLDAARSTRDIWLYEVNRSRGQRVTVDASDDFAPVWSPEGRRLLFSSMSNGLVTLHVKDVNSTRDPVLLEVDALGLGKYASDWSHDGRYVMYIAGGRAIARSDLWVAPTANSRNARALLESPFVETHGRFAPAAPWFAYASNETGQLEVYVDRFPDLGAKRLVSTKGGRWPLWARNGRELYYISLDNQLMAVAVNGTPNHMDIAVPRPLFTISPRPSVRLDAYPYDVTPDGQRFVVNTMMEDTSSNTMTVVLNWVSGLTKR